MKITYTTITAATLTAAQNNTTTAARVWAYPVKQAVWGGEPTTLYFATAAERAEYMHNHDYCDRLPRRKIYAAELAEWQAYNA